jgi:predicted N-acyltransferase
LHESEAAVQARIYESIDDIGCSRLETLRPGLDFTFGVLRAMERSLWGELFVCYICVEGDSGELLAFIPVYVGSNLNVNALLPRTIQAGYDALVRNLGTAVATRVAVAGSLISDRGWILMHSCLRDRKGALRLLLKELDNIAKKHHAQLGVLKDIHCDFPAEDRAVMREAGFVEACSLPTIRINTNYPSFEDYLTKHLSKNGRRHARKQFHKAEGTLTLRVIEDFEHMIPRVFGLHRAVYLKAKFTLEELPPSFFVEASRSTNPKSELVICETTAGRIVGSLMIFYNDREQQNKRIGIDYDMPDSGLIYNLLNYTGIQRAIARGLPTILLGQSSYLTKTRLGGELEEQYLLTKAYDPMLAPMLPLQRWWMARYSAANVLADVERGESF